MIYMQQKWCSESPHGSLIRLVIPTSGRRPGEEPAFGLHHDSRLILLVSPLEVGDLVIGLKVPDTSRDFVDQVVVVRHQEHCPLIPLEGDVQRVDGFQIQMVRGFIEHKHIWFLQHQLAEEQPGRLAARKHAGGFRGFVAGKQHLPQQARESLR